MTTQPHSPCPLVVTGPPGVGKSSVAKVLATNLDRTVVDLDEVIARERGQSPAELIRVEGEERFRTHEFEALGRLQPAPGVLSVGGGALTSPRTRDAVRKLGLVFGLELSRAELAERIAGDATGDRPLLEAGMERLLERRALSYRAVDARVDASRPVEAVANDVASRAERVHLLEAMVGADRSRVLVGEGLAEAAAGAIAHLDPRRPVLAIADLGIPAEARAARLDPIRALFDVVVVEVPGGEPVKTWAFAGEVLERALDAGCGRQSVVFGLGGGATCDLAGLVAHLLGRGAPLVLSPSTLLAQVDASVGGKCAVNMSGGRNLVGAFHPATDVIVDPELLSSLDPAETRSGLAELLKIGLISDAPLFDSVSARGGATSEDIARAIELKAAIVARDPYEGSERRTLNLGHTLGHALESASAHQLRHGEAVAIGIAAVARLSEELGFTSPETVARIISGLQRAGLPTSAEPHLCRRAAKFMVADKKSAAQEVALVCIHDVASVSVQTLPMAEAQQRLVHHGGHR